MTRYRKFIVALIDAGLILAATHGLEAHPAVVSVLAVLGALGVYAVPNGDGMMQTRRITRDDRLRAPLEAFKDGRRFHITPGQAETIRRVQQRASKQ